MLKLENIQVTLNKDTALVRPVLRNFSINIAKGEFAVIIGSNGCGKSTLFNTIAGNIRPDSGTIKIDGKDVTDQSSTQRSSIVSLVMQEPRLGTMENMTVAENLSIAYMRGRTRQLRIYNTMQRRKLFTEKLTMLNMGLENRLDDLVANLSGGQRQALSLIMAIIADYKILLLDEITAALDPKTSDLVMAIAARLVQQEGRTALMITHNMQHALTYGSKIFLLHNGRITREYNPQAKNDISTAVLAAAIGEF